MDNEDKHYYLIYDDVPSNVASGLLTAFKLGHKRIPLSMDDSVEVVDVHRGGDGWAFAVRVTPSSMHCGRVLKHRKYLTREVDNIIQEEEELEFYPRENP